ncbi:PcfJ domain-containing protein [Bacteroides muris (ex Fokt et al. 2023)]|uniref:PcfJ domain-containing protein n=1 Tax=Bacteroides muris (ex Fokt et al. 2023) TaxID=2937417 RepID=UPI0021531941|nr:PcfJ domain-containing protein [Bacteroides muris (ex Fokt et al. 2023)]
MRSVKYICLKDLKAEHDRWLHKVNAAEEKRRSIEKLQRAKQREDETWVRFYRYCLERT